MKKMFSCIFFLQFLVIKTLDPDWILIRIHFKCWIPVQNYGMDVLCRRSKEHKNDLWLLDPSCWTWREIQPFGLAPNPRSDIPRGIVERSSQYFLIYIYTVPYVAHLLI